MVVHFVLVPCGITRAPVSRFHTVRADRVLAKKTLPSTGRARCAKYVERRKTFAPSPIFVLALIFKMNIYYKLRGILAGALLRDNILIPEGPHGVSFLE